MPLPPRSGSLTARIGPTGRRPVAYIVAGGLLAGTFDMAFAWAFWALRADVPAQRIFQSVAAGLLGQSSFEGGVASAALGLVLHYLIATTMSLTYHLAAGRYPSLVRRAVASGAVYGLLLYAVMNHLVVPLSAAGPGSSDPVWIALSIPVHVGLIGVPIALTARAAVRQRRQI